MNVRSPGFRLAITLLARFGLASAYLSAIADRFGVWGKHGAPNVAWGDFQHFIAYTGTLLPWLPSGMAPIVAWLCTVLEAALGVGLLIGLKTKTLALASGSLLVVFALAMAFSTVGIHTAFASSVFTAAAASLLLAYVTVSP